MIDVTLVTGDGIGPQIAKADKLENAVAAVITEGKNVTYDMKPHRDDPTAASASQTADNGIEKMIDSSFCVHSLL